MQKQFKSPKNSRRERSLKRKDTGVPRIHLKRSNSPQAENLFSSVLQFFKTKKIARKIKESAKDLMSDKKYYKAQKSIKLILDVVIKMKFASK